jgi:hypothetical protein
MRRVIKDTHIGGVASPASNSTNCDPGAGRKARVGARHLVPKRRLHFSGAHVSPVAIFVTLYLCHKSAGGQKIDKGSSTSASSAPFALNEFVGRALG